MRESTLSRRSFNKIVNLGVTGLLTANVNNRVSDTNEWSTIQGDGAHTGFRRSAHNTSIGDGTLWEVNVGREPLTSPVVTDGAAFVGTESGRVVAFELEDGTRRWERTGTAEIRRAATVSDDTVYVNLDEETMYALDVETGETRWQTPLEARMYRNGAAVVVDETVYTCDTAGFVYAIDAISGEILWRIEHESGPPDGTISLSNGRIFLAKSTIMEAINVDDGSRTWRTRFRGLIGGPPTVADEVYLPMGPDPSVVGAFSAESGELQWTSATTTKSDLEESTLEEGITILPWSPVVTEEEIVATDTSGAIVSIAKDDGSRRWRHTIAARPYHYPIASQDTIYVPTEDGLVALSKSSGEVRWRVLEGQTPTSPALVGDRLIVSTTDGKLVALGDDRGTFDRWATELGVGLTGLAGLGGYGAYRYLQSRRSDHQDL